MSENSTKNQGDQAHWLTPDWKREFTAIFFARFGVIFTTALLVVVGAVVVIYYYPATYRAQASVLVRAKTPETTPRLLEGAQTSVQPASEADITSELEIVRSPALIRKTILSKGAQPDQDIGQAVKRFQNQLKTTVVPSSNVLRIEFYDSDPKRAEEQLNALLQSYVGFRQRIYSPPEDVKFLRSRAKLYEQELAQIHQQIAQQAAQAGQSPLIEREMTNNSDLERSLRERLMQARAEYARGAESLKSLEAALKKGGLQLFAFLKNDTMGRLAQQLALLNEEREGVARHYLPQSEELKGIDQQVQNVYSLLKNEAINILADRQQDQKATAAAIQSLEQSIAELARRNMDLQQHALQIGRLEQSAQRVDASYQTYLTKIEEAEINSAIADSRLPGEVTILSDATSSAELAFPKPLPTLIAGIVAGILLGLSLGFISEYLDHTINRPQDVHRHLNLPMICSIEKT